MNYLLYWKLYKIYGYIRYIVQKSIYSITLCLFCNNIKEIYINLASMSCSV